MTQLEVDTVANRHLGKLIALIDSLCLNLSTYHYSTIWTVTNHSFIVTQTQQRSS